MNKNKSQHFKNGFLNVAETKKGLSKQKSDFAKTKNFQNKIQKKMASINEIPDMVQDHEDVTKNIVDYIKRDANQHSFRSNILANGLKLNENFISNEPKTSQIKVIARFRPANKFEEELSKKEAGHTCVEYLSSDTVSITSSMFPKTTFTLDKIFQSNTTQKEFYDAVIQDTINEVLAGYNGTILTYGQSGSGKTHTMFGSDIYSDELKGVIPRSIEHIFDFINDAKDQNEYMLKFSILEIYRENLYDLLNPETKTSDIKIKEDPKKGVYVDNLTTVSIEEKEEFYTILESAEENRSIAETRLNKSSSRSHVVFMLCLKQKLPDDTEKNGTLNLVDLAGSEKISKTGASGETLEEAKKINQSLSCLGNVINCLTSGNKDFVPYRESKLTRILKDSLGGNFKTTLIVACSPHSYNAEDSLSTLQFAKRAKNVKNKVKINIKRSPEELERIISALNEKLKIANSEISRLQSMSVTKDCTENNSKISFNGDPFSFNFGDHSAVNHNYNQSNGNIEINSSLVAEISRLKEENENLKIENKNLNDDKINLYRILNIEHTLEEIERSVKKNLSELENSFRKFKFSIENCYFEENKILKNRLQTKELNTHEDYKRFIQKQYDLDLNKKLKNIDSKFEEFIQNIKFNELDDHLLKSYENIYENSKMFRNGILSSYLKTNNYDIIINGKETEHQNENLKKSYLQISALSIFYEKILNDLIGKLTFDLKNFDLNNKFYNEVAGKLVNLNKNFNDYLVVLNDVKGLKYSNPNLTSYQNNEIIGENLNMNFAVVNEGVNRKFIRNVTRKASKNIPGLNLINNIIKAKIKEEPEEKEKIIDFDIDIDKISVDENHLNFEKKKPVLKINSARSKDENLINLNEDQSETDTKKEIIHISSTYSNDKAKGSHKNFRKRKLKTLKNVLITPSLIEEKNLMIELKLLRKEKQLNMDFIEKLTNEGTEMQKKIFNNERMIAEHQEYLMASYQKEFQQLKSLFDLSKCYFKSQIEGSIEKIKSLSNLCDDMILNKGGRKQILSSAITESYRECKNNIIKNEKQNHVSMKSFCESFISEVGTASKKLDYIFIDLKSPLNSIILGSGISSEVPSKCPLYRSLKFNPEGDLDNSLLPEP